MRPFLWILLLGVSQLLVGQSVRIDSLSYPDLVDWTFYTVNRDPELVRAHISYIIEQTERHGQPIEKIDVYKNLAYIYYYLPNYGVDSIAYYQAKTVEAARATGDSSLVASRLRELAVFLKDSERPEEGRQRIMESLTLYESLDDPAGIASVERVLCDFFRDAGQFEKSLEYGRRTIDYYERTGNSADADFARMCALATLSDMNENHPVIELGERMLRDRAEGIVPYDDNRFFILGILKQARLNMGDTTSALQIMEEIVELTSIEVATGHNDLLYLGTLADYHLLKKDYEPALQALRQIAQSINDENSISNRVAFRRKFLRALRGAGAYEEALLQADTLLSLERKLHYLDQERTRADLLLRYENEQRDRTILQQEDQLATQRSNQRLTLLLTAVLIVGLLGLGYLLRTNILRRRELASRNAENELLLREIHHRVKNNLEIVSSLLELQSDEMEEGTARSAMQTGQNRVRSIGLLHQKLYQNDRLAAVELGEYFEHLADNLLETYDEENRLRIDLDIPECYAGVDTAVPLGLIANELLTNSIKYAYPPGTSGRIQLRVQKLPDGRTELSVRDWGIGKATGSTTQGTGFGTQLINMLTRQIGGTLWEDNRHGLCTILSFTTPSENKTAASTTR